MNRFHLFIVILILSLASNAAFARRHTRMRQRFNAARKKYLKRKKIETAERLIWIQSHRSTFYTNRKFMKRLFDRFENDQIVGLELLLAAPTKQHFESRWGHGLLRFVDNQNDAFDDVVLSIVADLDGNKVNYFKGLFGGYPAVPQMNSFKFFINQYPVKADRKLDRYVLISSHEMREKIVNLLKKWWETLEKHEAKIYASAIQDAKEEVEYWAQRRYRKKFKAVQIQDSKSSDIYGWKILTNDKNDKAVELIVPVEYKPILIEDLGRYTFLKNNCAGGLNRFLRVAGYPSRPGSGLDIRIPLRLPKQMKLSLVNPYPHKTIHILAPHELPHLKVEDLPEIVYEVCEDETCSDQIIEHSLKIWGPKTFHSTLLETQILINKWDDETLNSILGNWSNILTHHELVADSLKSYILRGNYYHDNINE